MFADAPHLGDWAYSLGPGIKGIDGADRFNAFDGFAIRPVACCRREFTREEGPCHITAQTRNAWLHLTIGKAISIVSTRRRGRLRLPTAMRSSTSGCAAI